VNARPESTANPADRVWMDRPLSSDPSLSADGQWLYYVSDREGVPQPWRQPARGGPAERLSRALERAGSVLAARSGDAVIVSQDRGANEHWQLLLWSRDGVGGARAITDAPSVIHSPGAWRDDHRFTFSSNERDARFFDSYEIDVRTGGRRRIHQLDSRLAVVAADAGRVLEAEAHTPLDHDLYLISEGAPRLLTPHSGEQTVFGADLTPTGVLVATNPEREFAALFAYREGRTPELLRAYPGDVEALRTDPVAQTVAVVVNRDGASEVHLVDLATGEDRRVPLPAVGVVPSAPVWWPDASAFVFELSSPQLGVELWKWDRGTGATTPLTHGPAPLPRTVSDWSLVSYRASDGLPIPYWEFGPRDGAPRGTIVVAHGGPESQARPRFVPHHLMLAARGWRVVFPNIRGSTGYGRTYVHLDDVRRRPDALRDLRDLADHLVASGKVSPGRLGIYGASYGGFLVLASIAADPERWGAAVDVVGISNLVTFLQNTGPWRRKLREAEYGSLESDREFLEAISPIHRVDRITTPLLVIHGANDPRVPIEEAEQIVAALRARGRPVEFLRFDDEGHGLVRRANRVEGFGAMLDFFDRYLGNGAPAGGPRAAD